MRPTNACSSSVRPVSSVVVYSVHRFFRFGTPVWGGLSSGQAAILLRDIAGINMIGGDVVEVSPNYDNSGATAIAGAHVAMELLCIWGSNSKNKRA